MLGLGNVVPRWQRDVRLTLRPTELPPARIVPAGAGAVPTPIPFFQAWNRARSGRINAHMFAVSGTRRCAWRGHNDSSGPVRIWGNRPVFRQRWSLRWIRYWLRVLRRLRVASATASTIEDQVPYRAPASTIQKAQSTECDTSADDHRRCDYFCGENKDSRTGVCPA
jgi:hypothetical protein